MGGDLSGVQFSLSCSSAAAPYADFSRLVWVCRLTGVLVLADDLVNAGDKGVSQMAGFRHVAAGNGVSPLVLHPLLRTYSS